MALNVYLSVIILNVNGLNASTKRHKVAEWIRTQDPYTYCLKETNPRSKDTHRVKVKKWKRYSMKIEGKKAGVAVLVSNN